MIFRRRAFSNVREIRSHPHFAEQGRALENVIARRAAASSPFPVNVRRGIIGAHLLAVAINAAVSRVNLPATHGHTRFGHGINVSALFVGLRIEVPDLEIRDQGQPHPRKGEGAENSEKEPFHMWSFTASSSCGLRNVGTLAVRPRPKSIKPK